MGGSRIGNAELTTTGGRPALFLDRDGVLNEPVWDPHTQSAESPLAVADVVLVPGAAAAVRRAAAAGLPVVLVSNQPSAAKGIVNLSTLHAVHKRVLELLAAEGATVQASYLCFHHPAGTVAELARVCDCRKPAPGLLLQAAADLELDLGRSWLIGDTDADAGAARQAGLAGVAVVGHLATAHRRGEASDAADITASTIKAAVESVLTRFE
ncbi:MAG TPA: HAD-IIIA family hydrolase [Jatrophihabitans sp.]